ncbi:MAG: methyltransferase domain-containing protein [Myxococcales bacterium]|jgi:ubiquinone/menaquinone biosynthesis C-methylase UbiE
MAEVSYDDLASGYDRRYVEHDYPGIDALVREQLKPGHAVLEVGCGTGHWVSRMAALGARATGLDPSAGMLSRARRPGDSATFVGGRAEALPFDAARFDCVFVINAMHHFDDRAAFVREAHRVLAPVGRLIVMGLDPSQPGDRWFVYDYFPRTLELDRARYPSADDLRTLCSQSGFAHVETRVAEHIQIEKPASEYLQSGEQMRTFTSQLLLLDDPEFEAGIDRIRKDAARADEPEAPLVLHADLRIHATLACKAEG